MRKTGFIAVLVVAFIATMSALTIAQGRDAKEKAHLKATFKARTRAFRELKLTGEQRQKWADLRFERAKETATLQANLKVAQLELEHLMDQNHSKASDVKAKVAQVNEARAKMLQSSVNYRLALKKILTPEQQKKLRSMKRRNRFIRRRMWK